MLHPDFIKALTGRERRKIKNHKLVCLCDGWPFYHRIGSKASAHYRAHWGTRGCLIDGIGF